MLRIKITLLIHLNFTKDFSVQVWDFETVDTADSTDESGLFEMEPMNEVKIPENCSLRLIMKSVDDEDEPTIWYAQVRLSCYYNTSST